MSAIADLATLQANLLKPIQRVPWSFNTLTSIAGRPSSLWKVGPLAGSSPSAPAVPDNTTAGGIPHVNGGSGQLWLPRMGVGNTAIGTLMICDRLLHCGGLSGTVTGAQAVQGNAGSGNPTISNANPAVISLNNHGFSIGQEVKFTTTGTLPSHIVSGTSYWVSVTSFGANAFDISTSRANALAGVNVSTNGDTNSGTHTVTGQVPTVLTRYTNGYGVMMGLEITTIVGVTGTTFTVSYTDAEAGSAKTSTAIGIGATNNREAGRFFQIPLANQDSASSGHNGATAIDSLTLAGTTGTAGDIAVMLYKPLLMMPIYGLQDPEIYDAIMSHGSNCPEIFDNASLFGIVWSSTSGTGVILPDLTFIET
jgi:hypothetical protein